MKKVLYALLILFAFAASAVVYLIWDDAEVRYSTRIEDYAPLPPKGEETYEKLQALAEMPLPSQAGEALADRWSEFDGYSGDILLQENAEMVIQAWDDLKPAFGAIHQLAQYKAIGDATVSIHNHMDFSRLLDIGDTLSAYTKLAVLNEWEEDGQEVLLDWYRIQRAWLPYIRTFINLMSCEGNMRSVHGTIADVAQWLRPEDRERWIEVLQPVPSRLDHIERAMWGEFCVFSETLEEILEAGAGLSRHLFLNPNRTLNTYASRIEQAMELAREKEWEELELLEERRWHDRPKNWGGRLTLSLHAGVHSTMLEGLLEMQAEHTALLENLRALQTAKAVE